jgi:imidazolonepropionase-like amidohydrolase
VKSRHCLAAAAALLTAGTLSAAPVLAPPVAPGADVQPFVRVPSGRIAITHVRVIDGTGAAPAGDRTVLIDGARIAGVQAASDAVPDGYRAIDATGKTLIPGIVGMHNHMFYIARPNLTPEGRADDPLVVPQMTFTAPRLYLANGVTTMRTTGSVEPYADLNVKAQIDAGAMPGPHMNVTGPYLEGANSPFIQMHQLRDADDARQTVAFWAEQGVNSFKAYMNITRAELGAAVKEAHRRGLKVTGHLCSVTYPEAAALGIDDLEHGFFVNTQLDPGKTPDVCPDTGGTPTLIAMKPGSSEANALIKLLVDHRVAVTSTLPVFEQSLPLHAPLNPRAMAVLTPEARNDYLYLRNLAATRGGSARGEAFREAYNNNAGLERQFAMSGGLLIAGPDPTGNGGVIPGFGDQREIELLVQDAGFSPVEAIRIATLNGGIFMGLQDHIGSIQAGKIADLVLIDGNPAAAITDIEKVDTVFKDGVGYDSAKLLDSVKGRYGQY